MSDRQKITAAPLPPESFSEREVLLWFDFVLLLLRRDNLYKQQLPKIKELCRLESRREQLIKDVEMEPQTLDYQLLTTEGFDRRFESYLSKFDTYQAAYEQVEFEHELNFNHRKYTGYESFRVARSRRKKT